MNYFSLRFATILFAVVAMIAKGDRVTFADATAAVSYSDLVGPTGQPAGSFSCLPELPSAGRDVTGHVDRKNDCAGGFVPCGLH
jgi:hypothetical protein